MSSSSAQADVASKFDLLQIENWSKCRSRPPRAKKRTNYTGTCKRSGSEGSKTKVDDGHVDSTYTIDGQLPPWTSKWNDISHLESIGIYYKESFSTTQEILDTVHMETGMFGHLSQEQRKSVQKLQDQVTFSFSIQDLYKYEPSDYLEDTKKSLVTFQQNIIKQFTRHMLLNQVSDTGSREPLVFKYHYRKDEDTESGDLLLPDLQQMFLVQDFTENTVLMLHYTDRRDIAEEFVSEAVFVDLFKSFVKMSGLIPSTGAEWKSGMNILQHHVTSEADVVILVRDVLNCNPNSTAVFVVSIVEVKNMTGDVGEGEIDSSDRKTRPQRNTNSDDSNYGKSKMSDSDYFEKQVHKQPDIYKRVAKKVLAQHGGELLLHANAYGRKFRCLKKEGCRLHPGMIVIGTQVVFTLLEYSTSHFQELKQKTFVEKGKSYIYYSEPKDFLKKEDRDELLQSFARLRNIKRDKVVRPSSATF